VLDDFRDVFGMSSILDVLYWFDAHKQDTGTRNILRTPCRADNITVYGKNHNLVRTLEAIKRMTRGLEHVNEYNTTYRPGRETLEHAESNAYRNAFSHIDGYLKTSDNRLFRHRDISAVLELANGYLHEEYLLSRRRLVALTNRMMLLEEHLSYELHYHVHYNAITLEDIIKRFFGRDEALQNKIENCGMIMNAIVADRAIR